MSLFAPLLLNQSDPLDHFRALNSGNSDSLETQMDWKETRDFHILQIDLPGFAKEDVKLEVKENRVLCIKAEKKTEQEGEEKEEDREMKWHCRERRRSGVIFREFMLPENFNVEGSKAEMRDGVLTIRVPKDKTKEKKKKKKEVKIFDGDGEGVPPKGIGRFVCCRA